MLEDTGFGQPGSRICSLRKAGDAGLDAVLAETPFELGRRR
jgi:hypothetical protein